MVGKLEIDQFPFTNIEVSFSIFEVGKFEFDKFASPNSWVNFSPKILLISSVKVFDRIISLKRICWLILCLDLLHQLVNQEKYVAS